MRDKREEAKRRALHALGITDDEIAQVCGVAKYTIRNWRKKRGLKGAPNRYLPRLEHMRRMELYWRGHTDMETARILGITVGAMHHWRQQHGIPPSYARDRKDSLCWECARARPQRCAWIDREEQVWEKAVRRSKWAGPVVIVCRQFELAGKEEEEVKAELDKARLDYKIAKIEMDYADPDYQDVAIHKYNAAFEQLNAVIREAKMLERLRRGGTGA